MTKADFVAAVATKSGLTKADAEKAVKAFTGAVTELLKKGDKLVLPGFGSFSVAARAARIGRNPQTGKELKIAATTVPRFTAGAGFKTAVAGKKAAKKK